MKQFSKLLEKVAVGMLLLGSIGMMGSMFLATADVVGTKFFSWPVPGALEITESTMVLIVFGALAFAQMRRAHIRVEILYGLMGARMEAFMDAFTHLIALVFFGLLAWQAFGEAQYGWEIREATAGSVRFPLYPARWILVFGTSLLLVQLVIDVISDVGRIWSGARVEPATPPDSAATSGQ